LVPLSKLLAAALVVAGFIYGCGGGSTPPTFESPGPSTSAGSFKVLSNRPDLVSGDDALVEIVPAPGVDSSKLTIRLNDADVTSTFALRPNGKVMGLVKGLKLGSNSLVARTPEGAITELTLVNHPTSGPILYGPQIAPWGCDPGAVDAACNRPVNYTYKYVSSDPAKSGFLPYDVSNPPSDIATTKTDAGATTPFIVRIETGVQNRDYYNVAVLFDPMKQWAPWAPQSTWNSKLLMVHGSGCGQGYSQTNANASNRVLDRTALSRGFAVLSVSLNDSGHNCNIAVQAEANMMAKERVIEAYGEIRYTFGYGGSGGALAQQWVANAYPGIYDGIIVAASFPDAGSTLLEIEDCALLKNYFNTTQASWSDEEKAAASGHLNTGVCNEWVDVRKYHNAFSPYSTNLFDFPGVTPTALGGCDAPAAVRYDPTFNPAGVRCDVFDLASTIFGKDAFGRAFRPWSNIGIQYGLSALKAGKITVDQFVDLNSSVGSHTLDYDFQPRRVGLDAPTASAAYRSGFINHGNGLSQIPIIDIRSLDISGIHHQYRSWVTRARLDRSNGTHANQAIWYLSGSPAEAYSVMDAWIAAIKADNSGLAQAQKVIKNRPAAANDRCNNADGTGLTMEQCTGAADASVRIGAGSPFTDDVVECALKPLDRSSYPAVFTDAQWSRMQSTFPTGVCDYSKPGKGQQPAQFWQTYLNAKGEPIIGGSPLPAVQ
jgi:hypothetical protein